MGNLTSMVKSQRFGEGESWGSLLVLLLSLSHFLLPQALDQKGCHGGGEGRGAARRHLGRRGEGREEGVGWLEKRGERDSSLRLGEEKKDVEHATYRQGELTL